MQASCNPSLFGNSVPGQEATERGGAHLSLLLQAQLLSTVCEWSWGAEVELGHLDGIVLTRRLSSLAK